MKFRWYLQMSNKIYRLNSGEYINIYKNILVVSLSLRGQHGPTEDKAFEINISNNFPYSKVIGYWLCHLGCSNLQIIKPSLYSQFSCFSLVLKWHPQKRVMPNSNPCHHCILTCHKRSSDLVSKMEIKLNWNVMFLSFSKCLLMGSKEKRTELVSS